MKIPIHDYTHRDRRATLAWAGPGAPVVVADAGDIDPERLQAAIAFLTDAKIRRYVPADVPADVLDGDDRRPIAGIDGVTEMRVALAELAGAVGLAPIWAELVGSGS